MTADNLVGTQCRAVVGLGNAKDKAWRSGQHMVGVWYSSGEDASAHQAAMACVPDGQYEALAISPLASGRLDPPDIALFYATPGAMMYFINGMQWAGYQRFDWSIVGESACADAWGRALQTREPSRAIPCCAERRCGGGRGGVSHGNGCAVDGYFPFWSRFLDRFEVIAFDMRNHGRNPAGDPAYHNYAHMVTDLDTVWRAVEAEFGAKPSAGLFHSMSAQSAMLQAMAFGARFEALVLFDPPNVPPSDVPARTVMLSYLHRLVDWARQPRWHLDAPSEFAAEFSSDRPRP